MNFINEKAVVSCYVDAAAILLMFVLLLLSERQRKRGTPSMRIYGALCWLVLFYGSAALAVCCTLFSPLFGALFAVQGLATILASCFKRSADFIAFNG